MYRKTLNLTKKLKMCIVFNDIIWIFMHIYLAYSAESITDNLFRKISVQEFRNQGVLVWTGAFSFPTLRYLCLKANINNLRLNRSSMMKRRKKPVKKNSRGDMLKLIKRAQSLIERSISMTEFALIFSHAGRKEQNFSAGLASERYI